MGKWSMGHELYVIPNHAPELSDFNEVIVITQILGFMQELINIRFVHVLTMFNHKGSQVL